MCRDYCACSPKVNKDNYGKRKNELDGLAFGGDVSVFYKDCYDKVVAEQDMPKLKDGFIELLRQLEVQNNC